MHKRFFRGFTIVELIIVISVIGILAAVTMVSYNGVQNRSNDGAVQSDLKNMRDELNIYYSDNSDKYPATQAAFLTLTNTKLTKTSYLTTTNAMLYCVTTADQQNVAVIGKSKSGKSYYVFNDSPVKEFTPAFPGTAATNCTSAGVASSTNFWIHTAPPSVWLTNV